MSGRKTKLTPELIKEFEKWLKVGNYRKTVCDYLGIGETTFYRWMEEGEKAKSGLKREFRESVIKAEAEAEMRNVQIIQREAENNWSAAFKYLSRKFPERWGEKNSIQANISHSGEINNNGESKVTLAHQVAKDEESRELLKQLWRRREMMKGAE